MHGITRRQVIASVSSKEAFAAIDARKAEEAKQAALEQDCDRREEIQRLGHEA